MRLQRRFTVAAVVGLVALLGIPQASGGARAGHAAGKYQIARPSSGKVASKAPTTRATKATAQRALSAVSQARLRAIKKAAAESGPATPGVERAKAPAVPSASTLTNFAGLDRISAQNNGFIFVPPDTIVARSPLTVLEGANSAVRLFNSAGGVLSTLNLNSFFLAATSNGLLFDPKVYYDRLSANPRYVAVALQKHGDNDTSTTNDFSNIHLAISRTANPTNLTTQWCHYHLNAIRFPGTTSASWADYPGLGAGTDKFLITDNQFKFAPPRPFTEAIVRSFNKSVAYNNASACPSIPFATFSGAATAGTGGFTIQPVQSYTAPSSFTGTVNPAYAVSSVFGTSNGMCVWRVKGLPGVSASTISRVCLSTPITHSIPPGARQPGTSILLDTGDVRTLQAGGMGNVLWGVLSSGCNFTAGTPLESCWIEHRFGVGQSSTGALTAGVLESHFTGFGNNQFVWEPGVAPNSSFGTVNSLQRSATNVFLTALWEAHNVNAAYTSAANIAVGTAPQTYSNRTGDYTGAQTDPSVLTRAWVAGERAITVSGVQRWDTRISQVQTP